MSSKKKAVTATPEVIEMARAVVDEARKCHTYSVSRIYAAYNAAMDKQDKPQSCSTCLTRRVNELEAWLRVVKPAKPAEPAEGGEARA